MIPRRKRHLPIVRSLLAIAFACIGSVSAQAGASYRISGGELIEVVVFQEKDLSGAYRVSADGEINMPLIGSVTVGGKSANSASAAIRTRLLDGYLVNPQVTLRVTKFAEIRFTVLGQVRQPGAMTVPANERVDLLQAIGTAGGFTRLANPRKVIIKRKVRGKITIYTIDAKALTSDASNAPLIQSGDVIMISESRF